MHYVYSKLDIYSGAGLHIEAEKVHTAMKVQGIHKIPGLLIK